MTSLVQGFLTFSFTEESWTQGSRTLKINSPSRKDTALTSDNSGLRLGLPENPSPEPLVQMV